MFADFQAWGAQEGRVRCWEDVEYSSAELGHEIRPRLSGKITPKEPLNLLQDSINPTEACFSASCGGFATLGMLKVSQMFRSEAAAQVCLDESWRTGAIPFKPRPVTGYQLQRSQHSQPHQDVAVFKRNVNFMIREEIRSDGSCVHIRTVPPEHPGLHACLKAMTSHMSSVSGLRMTIPIRRFPTSLMWELNYSVSGSAAGFSKFHFQQQ